MAVHAVPGRRSLIGAVSAVFQARSRKPGRAQRIAGAVARVREHLPTLAALASFDTAAWLHGATAGMVVLGVSLLVADFAVTGK